MQIRTRRLVLRPPVAADAPHVSKLAGDYDVACMTAVIPHPYSEQMAEDWLVSAASGEEGVVFMIEREGTLIGCTGYRAFGPDHAELGYWIGKPYWSAGYATEAVKALIAHAFDAHGFSHLKAGHFADNSGSQAVLRRLGFCRVGEEMRDCEARGDQVPCYLYRLDRETAHQTLGRPGHATPAHR